MVEMGCTILFGSMQFIMNIGQIATDAATNSGDFTNINKSVGTAANTLISGLTSVGMALVLFFFILSCVDLYTSERLTLEMMMKHFAKLATGWFFVSISASFYKTITEFGGSFTKLVAGKLKTDPDKSIPDFVSDPSTLSEKMAGSLDGWQEELAFFALALLIGLLLLAVGAAMQVIAYTICITRLLELNIRGAMLPIGLALISEDGLRGPGGRYLKKFIAVSCQLAIIAIIGYLTVGIMEGCTTNVMKAVTASEGPVDMVLSFWKQTFVLIGCALASITGMSKSVNLINDAFGA